jgi:O-antigen/teichoic acid export membrane protein
MGMVFNTLYNLTDIWFADYLGDDALAGMSIAASVFFLLLSIGVGLQAGASAMIAPGAGRGETHEVKDWINNVSGMAICFSVLSFLLGAFAARPLVVLLGAEPNIEPLAMEYLWVTLAGSIGFPLLFGAAGALMAFGDTKSNRNALAIGFLANFVLNPLFMFGFMLVVARTHSSEHISTRQYGRIVDNWVASIGLNTTQYGTHTMRRTKPSLIFKKTKNLRACQLLLGHRKLESTVRYLGIEVDDALEVS